MNIELEEFLDSLYPEVAESPIESVSHSRCSNETNWETLEAVTFDNLEFEPNSRSKDIANWETVETVTFEDLKSAHYSKSSNFPSWETLEAVTFDNLESEPNSSTSNFPELETMETVTFEDLKSAHYSKSNNFPSWETLEAVTFDNLEFEPNSSPSNFPDLEIMETVTLGDLESGYHSKSSEGSCCKIRETEEFDDLQNEHPSTSASTRTKVKTCSICEDWATGNHYGVVCCNPCRIFFRKSIVQKNIHNKCIFNSKCVINKKSGRNCSYCRLQKCFKKGMKKELVKPSRAEKEICVVCGNSAIGSFYGVLGCQNCYRFFQRTITQKLSNSYSCKFFGNCSLTKKKYIMCRYCRLQKCHNVGMREYMVGKNKKHGNLATDDQKE